MARLEDRILSILNKKPLSEEAVQPDFQDLGSAPTHPQSGENPDWTGPIKPGQASLPTMNPTPGVGTVEGDGQPFTPNEVREEDEDDEGKDPVNESPAVEGDAVSEERTAEDENAQNREKYKTADKQEHVPGQEGVIKEDILAIFAGMEISEEFVDRASTLYYAAISDRVNHEVNRLQEEFQQKFDEELITFKEELTTKVDSYLNYVCEEWVNENKLAIDTGLKAELTEDFIQGLKTLFAENYIEIPTEKVDVVESLAKKVAELEESLNTQLAKNAELSESVKDSNRFKIVTELSENLTATQKDKLRKLVETVEFKDAESFKKNVAFLKESHLIQPKSEGTPVQQTLTEEAGEAPVQSGDKKVSPDMKPIYDTLARLK